MKKILSLILSLVLVLSMGSTAFAADSSTKLESIETSKSVFCPEFPNAYIITEKKPIVLARDNSEINLGEVTATVFVEETYKLIDNQVVVTNSRLLSKDEVMSTGVQNFAPLESQAVVTPTATSASNSKGKLTITFSGTYSTPSGGVSCTLKGNAKWSGFNTLYSPSNNPAVGLDFIGITWAGKHQVSSSSCTGSFKYGTAFKSNLAEAVANVGRVWSFQEYKNNIDYVDYVNNLDVKATITKAKLTGGGNKAEAVLKYIHTYQSTTGSISISASGAGFSLSSTSNQWSIACVVNNIPY